MTAQIKQYHGVPTLFLDGRPTFAGYLWLAGPGLEGGAATEMVRCYAEAGIHLYALDVGTSSQPPEWCGPGEGRTEHWDFSPLMARLGRVIDTDAEARFHLRFHLEMPEWWQRLYPEECEVNSDGQRRSQSFASTLWREQAKAFLRACAAYLDSRGLAERVIAFQTGAGHTGEWCKGETSMASRCGDYSEPMRRHFQRWLHSRYSADVVALRRAWADPDVTFATAAVPSAAAQLGSAMASLRDPRREQRTIDYFRCLAELCADLIIDFNHTVKMATGGRMLAGAFYGYLLEMAWNAGFFHEGPDSDYATLQRSGHLGLARVLASPDVDFLVSPYSYGFRGIGGAGGPMLPTESLRLHGKLYIFEEDSRTHLSLHDSNFGQATTIFESEAILKRNVAEVVSKGFGIWWLGGSLQYPHIDPVREPAFRPLLKRFQEIGAFALHLDRTPSAEIAVLVDDESFYYEAARNDLDIPLIFQQRLWGLSRLGAPTDYCLLQDLIGGRLGPYKLYIFLNSFCLDRSRRQALARELRRDGRVALWIYAPGYIEDEPGLAHMTDLTGFHFGQGDHAWGPLVHITNFAHPITQGLPQELVWGTNSRLAPLFHLEDPAATILGQVVYSQGRCKPGFGVKEYSDWRSVYVAAPNVPSAVLRGIARYAGVHLYSDAGDVLYATHELLGVHTVAGGQREYHLPSKVEIVYDLFAGRPVAQDAACFRVTLAPASTALYYTGKVALLEMLLRK